MDNLILSSATIGIVISLLAYEIGLAAQRKWSVNKLAERSGIAPSVLKRTVKPYATVQRTSVETIARLCIGLEIPFKEFWDSPIFDEVTTKQQEAESK